MSETDPISVLHVDDDSAFTDLTATMVEREDDRVSVEAVSNASEGLDHLATTAVDCVVSDYDMPGRNGIEFLRAVREDYPDLPFILFTGKGSEAVASDAFSGGATDYLQKEVGTDQYAVLVNKITNYVSKYRAEQTMKRRARAVETANDGIAIIDEDGHYIEVNSAYADIYGSTREALAGEHWTLTVPDDEVDQVQRDVFPRLGERGHWTGEIAGQRADGSTYPRELSLSLLDDGGHVCVVRDVTERKAREQAIEGLHSTAQALMAAETADQVADIAVDAMRDILDLPANGLHLYEERSNGLAPVAWTERTTELVGDPPTFDPGQGIAWTAFETGEPQVYDDISTVSARYNPDTAVRSQIAVPLADHGVLLIGAPEPDAFDDTDVDLARTLATHVETALDRITRKQDLSQERTFVEQAVDALDNLFYVVGDDGTLRRWNDRFSDVTGYTDEELDGMHATAFFPEEYGDRVSDAMTETLQTGAGVIEAPLLTKDGERIPYEYTGSRLTDADGEVSGFIGIGRDISERRTREETMSALHDATRDLITSPDPQRVADLAVETALNVLEQPINGIWLYDADSSVLRPAGMTAEAGEVLDEQPAYADGDSLSWRAFADGELKAYDDLQTEPERLNTTTRIRSEVIVPLGQYGVMNFGSTEPAAFSDIDISVIQILGKTVEAALGRAKREQQLRNQRAELERHNERLEKFTRVVSHDLRNPLNVADGRVELARQACDSDHLDMAADAHARMKTLIDDLLTIAREGRQVGETETVVLSEIVENCWQRVDTADATLACDTARELRADPGRLKQLLENLFRNAVEHGGAGVTVTVGEVDDGDGFYVADDGPGLPAEHRDKLFDAGYSTTDGGTGFGLNIIEEIVTAHGWDITATDSESGGARFAVTAVEFA